MRVKANGPTLRPSPLIVAERVKRLQEPLPATLPASKKERVAWTLGRGGVPLRSARSHSVPRRGRGEEVAAGGAIEGAAG